MIRLVIDTMGGDNSPDAPVEGALMALKEHEDLYVIFTGDEETVKATMEKYGGADPSRYEIVHAPEVVTGEDKPTDAVRLKRESSMIKGIKLLRQNDDVDGMVSTGATGALVAAATVRIGRVEGVIRPVFCPVIPSMKGSVTGICDSGANVDCTPAQLLQFSIMGKLYMQAVFGVEKPRIALLNIGTETEKGDDLHKKVYKLLARVHGDDFVGNMEGRDLLSGNYDLVVSDGFSGNILIKATEGTALELLKMIKKQIYSKTSYKIGAMFMKQMFADIKDMMDYQNYGGSVLIGTEKIIVKGHGSSSAKSVATCIRQAIAMTRYNLNDRIAGAVAEAEELLAEDAAQDGQNGQDPHNDR